MTVSAEIDERALRELYLPAFEHAVTVARPWTVMCAYNRINGVHASEHRELLTGVLREEWGFGGFVVSDWAAVHDRPKALAAGLDLEMPGPRPRRVRSVVDAVRAGTLAEAVVDTAALRILRGVNAAASRPAARPPDLDAHHALARRIAGQGMVLLKNDDGILPLSSPRSLAVIGRSAKAARIQGGGSSQITPTRVDAPIDEIAQLAVGASIMYADGFDDADHDRAELIAEAVGIARAADVAIVFADLPIETEGADRQDLDLPAQQVALIRAVAAAQPRAVVVLSCGSAVVLAPWHDDIRAILLAWYAGQAAGGAIADILFGVVNPSGRLAESFPRRLEDTSAFLDFPGDEDTVRYGEGIFVGYRWYDTRALDVLYPFGHGLSYTTFEYGDPRVSSPTFTAHEATTVSTDVTNTGKRGGSEVVQVYVHDPVASVRRPRKELAGFAKVYLEPGETTTVAVRLDARAFSYWDPGVHRWVAEPGTFTVMIGHSSRDVVAAIDVELVGGEPPRSALTEMSPLRDWLGDERSRRATSEVLETLVPILGGTMGDGTSDLDDLGPHFDNYFGSMPMRDLLEFAAPAGGPDPDEAMDRLLGALVR